MRRDLREVANEVAAIVIVGCQDVEVERLDIVVECLVVQEQFSQQTQVLAVDLAPVAIDLKHRQAAGAVDLIAWRTPAVTLVLTQHTH